MPSRDLKSHIDYAQSLAPAVYDDEVNGAGVDLNGYNSALVVISAGVSGGTDPSFKESDDNLTFTAVGAAHLQGAEPVITAGEEDHRIGYVGSKRYIRAAITVAAGTLPTLACTAGVVRGNPYLAPL